MGYRVNLVRYHERDLAKALALQEKFVEFNRRQAVSILSLPADAPLNDERRNRLRTLAAGVFTLGQILREQGNAECVQHYLESISHFRRTGNKQSEAIVEFNLGCAYMELPAIYNLDAAGAACQRCLDLHKPNDTLGRSRCIKQIGMVHHERFHEARQHGESAEILMGHLQVVEECYL